MAKKFQPKKWPTIITLAMFIVLECLGTWQVHRLHWKEAMLQTIHDSMAQKPVPLPEQISDASAWEYRRVTMAGKFLYDRQILVKPRVLDGQVGYHEYVPFRRASGGIVFVNRGWISDDLMKKASNPPGMMQIEGIVQAPHKFAFTPENNPDKNDWYWPDVDAMAEAAHVKNVAPVIVTVAARKEGVYPAGGQIRLDVPNDHKQYAIFWYAMALVLLGVYFLSQRREEA